MTEKRNKPISRREALKAIGAVTGVTVLSAARGDWETPLVQVGALPAHAQGSGTGLRVVNYTGGPIRVSIAAAASVQVMSVDTVCTGTEISNGNGGSEVFPLAPGYYDVTSCTTTSSDCDEANSTKLGQMVVEGEIKEVIFECEPE